MDKTNIKVSLRFMGADDYDVNEITNSLNVIPSESWYSLFRSKRCFSYIEAFYNTVHPHSALA